VGLDGIIEQRMGKKTMGFGAEIQSKHERKFSEILASLQPEDLLKYGLIPEFVGRMPWWRRSRSWTSMRSSTS